MRTFAFFMAVGAVLLAGCDELAMKQQPQEPKTLDGLLAHLQAAGCELGEQRESRRTRQLVAKAGAEVDVDGEPIEFYEFEEIYAVSDIVTKLRAFGVEGKLVLVNDKVVMIGDRKQDNWKKASDAFKSY